MGPRLVSRGNAYLFIQGSKTTFPLQWGRDSLVAEIANVGPTQMTAVILQWGRDSLVAEMPRKRLLKRNLLKSLQWGRDSLVAEMSESRYWPLFRRMTSMGPRLVSRGNAVHATQIEKLLATSMGPRLVSRGNQIKKRILSEQFSDFNGAATR